MIFLHQSVAAINQVDFNSTLKQKLGKQPVLLELLQQAMQLGSCTLLDQMQIMINNIDADKRLITIEAGVFYHSIIAGCQCADDPGPVERNNEYAEICITIDRHSAQAILKLK